MHGTVLGLNACAELLQDTPWFRRISRRKGIKRHRQTHVQLPSSHRFARGERLRTRQLAPDEMPSWGTARRPLDAVVRAKTAGNDERERQGDYMTAGIALGGGSGTFNMVIGGCSRRAPGTEPMGESAAVGALGARQEVSVHAPPQPAIAAQALKAMPIGPRRTHTARTIPTVTRCRVERMGFIVLCRERTPVYRERRQPLAPSNVAQLSAEFTQDVPFGAA